VIVWLNGTFGAGKTATAAALVPLIPEARLFDPETVGYMLQPNLADHPVSDFQHWAPWRPLVVATATELARYTGEHLIAAQTILNRDLPCRDRHWAAGRRRGGLSHPARRERRRSSPPDRGIRGGQAMAPRPSDRIPPGTRLALPRS
jgi:hypothetical protein